MSVIQDFLLWDDVPAYQIRQNIPHYAQQMFGEHYTLKQVHALFDAYQKYHQDKKSYSSMRDFLCKDDITLSCNLIDSGYENLVAYTLEQHLNYLQMGKSEKFNHDIYTAMGKSILVDCLKSMNKNIHIDDLNHSLLVQGEMVKMNEQGKFKKEWTEQVLDMKDVEFNFNKQEIETDIQKRLQINQQVFQVFNTLFKDHLFYQPLFSEQSQQKYDDFFPSIAKPHVIKQALSILKQQQWQWDIQPVMTQLEYHFTQSQAIKFKGIRQSLSDCAFYDYHCTLNPNEQYKLSRIHGKEIQHALDVNLAITQPTLQINFKHQPVISRKTF